MRIMKFGGTSLGSAERIRDAAAIVSRAPRPVLVVASAMTGATNDLLASAAKAAAGRRDEAIAILDRLEARHLAAGETLGVLGSRVAGLPADTPDPGTFVKARFDEARQRLEGVALLGELTDRTRDAIAATGELSSSVLLAAILPGSYSDVRRVMRTDDAFGAAAPDMGEIEALCHAADPALVSGIVVTQGYIGRTASGITTTLGRGGSDYSAAILGAALGAGEIEIWTDVDGMLTADPRVVPGARLLPEVSFEEASELAYFGAKVLHPATIRPALARGIPVRVLNTFQPEGRGTLIRDVVAAPASGVRAVASRKGITVVQIANPRMLMAHGYSARVFDVFGRHKVSVDLIATSEVSISLTVDDASGLAPVTRELGTFAEVSVIPGQAIVAVVGSGMRDRPRVAATVFGALGDINVTMISMGASDRNLSFVVKETDADEATRRLHRTLFEDPR
ncbi:MAG: aspartate kinase [Acidobacteriota bacterium]